MAAPFEGRGPKSAQTILVPPSISYTPKQGLTLPGYCWLAFIREEMPKWVRIDYKLKSLYPKGNPSAVLFPCPTMH